MEARIETTQHWAVLIQQSRDHYEGRLAEVLAEVDALKGEIEALKQKMPSANGRSEEQKGAG